MNATQKLAQYLGEAKASEDALVRVLQSQIAMTPEGPYRAALESHLKETRSHSRRVAERIRELDGGRNPLQLMVGLAEQIVGQTIALSKAPLDLMRGTRGEERVLKNAKDAAATEALEIATYTALERLATAAGDETTARLANSIRADEQAMLERILREIPRLTDAVAHAELGGADELAISGYDDLTAEQIVARLPGLSQAELGKIDSYERRHEARSTVLSRVESLRAVQPWPRYDEQTVAEIESALAGADERRLEEVRAYERAHKDRAGVLRATERKRAAH